MGHPAICAELRETRISGRCEALHLQHGDIVLLAEALRGCGDGYGRDVLRDEIRCAIEAEEISLLIARFDYAVSEEDEPVAGMEGETGTVEIRRGNHA